MQPPHHMLRVLGRPVLDLLFPPACRGCKAPLPETMVLSLCGNCIERLRPLDSKEIIDGCLASLSPSYLDGLWVAYPFEETLQALIHAFKYQQMPGLARSLGDYVRRQHVLPEWIQRCNMVIPVPLHRDRKRQRGFNQSTELARGLFPGKFAGERLLVRSRHTASQAKLSRAERRKNVAGAFLVRRSERVAVQEVVVLDDVFTTGATLNECARLLKNRGATAVLGVVLATPLTPIALTV